MSGLSTPALATPALATRALATRALAVALFGGLALATTAPASADDNSPATVDGSAGVSSSVAPQLDVTSPATGSGDDASADIGANADAGISSGSDAQQANRGISADIQADTNSSARGRLYNSPSGTTGGAGVGAASPGAD